MAGISKPTPQIPFPELPLGEWSIYPTKTAFGLFAYRHSQAKSLLQLPDLGGGDFDATQRREALLRIVPLLRPLAALALAFGVVALEDFIRDLAARLAETPSCVSHFPNLSLMRAQPIMQSPEAFFKRTDRDPATFLDPESANALFKNAIGVEPVPASAFWHLRDLALIRHTVVHHGALIRNVDRPRFAHFIVDTVHSINPPPEFVEAELQFLYKLGRQIETTIRSAVFGRLIAAAGKDWSAKPSPEILELIEIFAYFGYLESTTVPVGHSDPGSDLRRQQDAENQRIRSLLVQRCVDDLTTEFGK